MKKIIRSILVTLFLFCAPFFVSNVFADLPPDPGGGGPGGGDDPVGGGSPVGSGILITMVLSSMYGAKKVYHMRKK
jgi:hypothetical protein